MTISTVITVYNLEKYIEAALQSVFNQTRRPEEIIVVDDCSTDNSARIIQKYADQVKYVRMPKNGGVMLAFIKGVEAATGDILSFLDGDDIWHPNKLEEVEKAFLADKNRIFVTHDYECIDGQGNARPYSDDRTHYNTARIVEEANGDLDKMDELLRNSILCFKGVWLGSAFCLKRKNFDAAKFKKIMCALPNPELACQDHPAATFALLENKSGKAFYIDKVLFQYRLFGLNSSGVSMSLESARRTVEKYKASMSRTAFLVSEHPELIEENFAQKMKLLDGEYLQKLYSGQRLAAIRNFFRLSFNFWDGRKIFKEFQRIIGTSVLGTERFLKIKSRGSMDK